MIKNLNIYVFDMGNVITKPSHLNKMYIESEMKCDYPYFKNLFYKSQKADEVYKGLISDNEFFDHIRKCCNSSKSVSDLMKIYNSNKGGIYLDTVNTIKELKEEGNDIYLLSNLKQIDYDYLKDNIDLKQFNKLFLSYRLGMSKPNEDIYNFVIKELGTNKFHFFDDSTENVIAAEKLGINVHLTTGEDIAKCIKLIKRK